MSERVLISPSELSDLMTTERVVLIDTRDAPAYAEAHLPGAFNMHEIFTYLATSTPEGLAALKDKFVAAFGLSGAETAAIYKQSMASGFGQSCRGHFGSWNEWSRDPSLPIEAGIPGRPLPRAA